ncbi:cytochrome C oxidase subunit IV [Piscirickettsia salmonis]|uniref:Cytochrome o ubiquinol oxidase protein CyoD n=1 Tax=Piscirickettsia salmonis TaxID=1238 RepID=A0A095BP46_PISSA|nr:prokaryotic cytochrome C oxidase subunit IV family protein [Piscirickettsia salmonis]OAJ35193.1 Cytochrome bo(3) ubiquinol oxidase subunit 4 [Piscirickettsiaceae bacterium NZ-RLO1]AKP74822.1 cytochrome C oxidase subunit IV [Piscirickettsia salmonis LF-89 = ATCC VR-1361]ALA23512.1 prokaryotic Cytochrome C oxidase subunit IV family protein [Piscirickettsia salmonis]ALB21234.1 prokaryotic Cytochrome C oxidase subunit IV family protein [Piscirickettsia salmonis]ALY01493.1 cytochrome C oxidase s
MSGHYEVATNEKKNLGKSLRNYALGFILSAVLFAVATLLVSKQALSSTGVTLVLLIILAVLLLVQLVCFFGLNTRTENARWDMLTFAFTILVTVVVIGGSLWIMYNLNYYMVH